MKELVFLNKLHHTDIDVHYCGMEEYSPGFSSVYDGSLYGIVYVLKGKGVLRSGEASFNLQKNQGYILFPGVKAAEVSDSYEPWTRAWVLFNGLRAKAYLEKIGLSPENPVFTYNKDESLRNCFKLLIESKKLLRGREFKVLGTLYTILSELYEAHTNADIFFSQEDQRTEYIRSALEYIEKNFCRDISINDISDYVGLNANYFCSIFKEAVNMSPKKYITSLRINKAFDLMKYSRLTVRSISQAVGYKDPFTFSKAFKRYTSLSPTKMIWICRKEKETSKIS